MFAGHSGQDGKSRRSTAWPSSQIAILPVAAWVLVQAVATEACGNIGNGSGAAGCRMFFGETPLRGSIIGHNRPLPPEVVACANCHVGDARSSSGGSFAPSLGPLTLTEPRRRRGGPPSQFSAATFCRLLRTGLDPAYIIISRQMPRYVLDDDQCLDLWHYLLEQDDGPRKEQQ
jgi:hypothetical protein